MDGLVSQKRRFLLDFISHGGGIEVSDYQGESLRKILYQAYDMTSFLKSVDMLTIQI